MERFSLIEISRLCSIVKSFLKYPSIDSEKIIIKIFTVKLHVILLLKKAVNHFYIQTFIIQSNFLLLPTPTG